MNFIEEKILNKGTDKNLITRFPPEPNGHLHIGHTKSMVLNFGLAEKYKGECNLRFDDTNPLTEDEIFEKSIIEDVKWLGFKPTKIKYASDYFLAFHLMAVKLILEGKAYVDKSTSEEIAKLKGTPTSPGKPSKYRNTDPGTNMNLFNDMLDGKCEPGSMVLRAKIDMEHDNMLMRDPIIYRIIDKPHHRTGNDWAIYPTYDFAHPLSDYLEKITDSLCTLEFEVHRPLYNWILENYTEDTNLPEQTEFNSLNIDHTVLSKRKLKELVEKEIVTGWDDPRMPTLKGLRRRGYTSESIKNFCEKVGWTKNDVLVDYALLESCVREDLNKKSNRLMVVMDPIKLTITNMEWETPKHFDYIEIENNPEDPSAGKRNVLFTENLYIEREDFREEANRKYHRLKLGGEVRLKGAYIIKAYDCIKDEDGNVIEVLCTYDKDTKSGMKVDRKVKGTIHWVSINSCVELEIREYDRLFSDPTPDKHDDDFTNYINPNSLSVHKAYGELDCLTCKTDNPVQFMRKGYYVLDKNTNSETNTYVFNKTTGLRDNWKG